MAVPEGFAGIGRVGFSDKGDYSEDKVYNAGDVVYSEGSSYLALRNKLQGIKPQNDGTNWRFMARGFGAELLSGIMAIDESGLIGSAGKSVNAQELINVMADKIATQLLLKTDVISQIIDDATKAASMAALYAVDQKVNQVNSDFLTKKFELANRVPIASGVRVAISVPFTIPTGYDVVSISAYSGSQNVDTSLAYYSSTEVRVMATNKSKTEYECPMVVLAVFRRK